MISDMDLPTGLECRLLEAKWEESLIHLFQTIEETGDSRKFHPHPFTKEEARKLVQYQGQDLYYILVKNKEIIGYGILRGWDEGYDIPSLGIYLHPSYRGKGLGKMMMVFLHAAARERGASQVRLKVYCDNQRAICLYQKMGYEFKEKDDEQWIGLLKL